MGDHLRARHEAARPDHIAPALVTKLDRALATQRRARIRYRGARDRAPAWRLVDPLGLRFSKGHLYLIAFDTDRAALRTFKLDRITQVEVLPDKAQPHAYDPEALFANSNKIWIGDPHDLTVRLSPQVARFANEYKLVPNQRHEDQPDGSVLVHARVAGLPEALRWVLSWGKDAEALEPRELRDAIAAEVQAAAAGYATATRAPSRALTTAEAPGAVLP